jgi:hypothetical protein
MTYIGGIDNYEKTCREKMMGWKGFNVNGGQKSTEGTGTTDAHGVDMGVEVSGSKDGAVVTATPVAAVG